MSPPSSPSPRRPTGNGSGSCTAFEDLAPQVDAEPALARLRSAGVRVVALTNGGAAQTKALLERAGPDGYVEQVLTAAEAGRWKPAAVTYHHAAGAGRGP